MLIIHKKCDPSAKSYFGTEDLIYPGKNMPYIPKYVPGKHVECTGLPVPLNRDIINQT